VIGLLILLIFGLKLTMQPCLNLVLPLLSIFFLDSTMYVPDIDHASVVAMNFRAPIVDYIAMDFLYIATDDYMYKIDPAAWSIIDKTPLPLRFNYLAAGEGEIMLISSNEIIVLDRQNLGFRSGIGIEVGDHQPVIKNQSIIGGAEGRRLYLLSDEGTKSTLKIIDRRSGKMISKATMDRAKCVAFDDYTRTLVALDKKNNLTAFDLTLKKQRKFRLAFDVQTFTVRPEGFSMHSEEGVFLVNRTGKTIDFQPTPGQLDHSGSVMLTRNEIVSLDTNVLRTNVSIENNLGISRLLPGTGSTYRIGTDRRKNLYLIQTDPLTISSLNIHHRQLEHAVVSQVSVDSLWYLQIAAFANLSNAFGMYDEMRAKGVPVIVDSARLYRVKFGGFSDKLMALDLVDRMQMEGWLVYEPRLPDAKPEVFYVNSERFSIIDGVVRKE
jgi:hypothetical protein